MPIPSFVETLNRLNTPHQVKFTEGNIDAKVIIDDEALTSDEAHALHQLITDPNSPKTAIIALRILAKETDLDIVSIGSRCIFKGNTTEIYTYPHNARTF